MFVGVHQVCNSQELHSSVCAQSSPTEVPQSTKCGLQGGAHRQSRSHNSNNKNGYKVIR